MSYSGFLFMGLQNHDQCMISEYFYPTKEDCTRQHSVSTLVSLSGLLQLVFVYSVYFL